MIINCVNVGAGSVVGAGAVVIRDIPDAVVAVGTPARICRRVVQFKESAKNDNVD